jgi:hypothetical protein
LPRIAVPDATLTMLPPWPAAPSAPRPHGRKVAFQIAASTASGHRPDTPRSASRRNAAATGIGDHDVDATERSPSAPPAHDPRESVTSVHAERRATGVSNLRRGFFDLRLGAGCATRAPAW